MENKILIFGAGVLLGYFLFKELNKNQSQPATTTSTTNPREQECKSKLEESLKIIRVPNIEEYKKNFMQDCISQTGMFSSNSGGI